MVSTDPYIIQPMTLLDAVNYCLRTIGSTGVLSLDIESITADAELALKAVHDYSIQLQSKGWQWNTEKQYTVDAAPHSDPVNPGGMTVPSTCLKVDTSGLSAGIDLVLRGRRLYDPVNSTYDIGQRWASVTVRMVVALDFEETPQAARNYITAMAALNFSTGRLLNDALGQYLRSQTIQAYLDLCEDEDESDDDTLYEKNAYFYRQHRNRRFT